MKDTLLAVAACYGDFAQSNGEVQDKGQSLNSGLCKDRVVLVFSTPMLAYQVASKAARVEPEPATLRATDVDKPIPGLFLEPPFQRHPHAVPRT